MSQPLREPKHDDTGDAWDEDLSFALCKYFVELHGGVIQAKREENEANAFSIFHDCGHQLPSFGIPYPRTGLSRDEIGGLPKNVLGIARFEVVAKQQRIYPADFPGEINGDGRGLSLEKNCSPKRRQPKQDSMDKKFAKAIHKDHPKSRSVSIDHCLLFGRQGDFVLTCSLPAF